MKPISIMLFISAVLFLAALFHNSFIDAEDGVLIIAMPAQAAECRDGGGCMAWSTRETQKLANHAAGVGFQYGARTCSKDL